MAKRTSGRVLIPKTPKELCELAVAVYQKHVADGTNSMLNAQINTDWAIIGNKAAIALAKHIEAEEYKRKMEAAYLDRDANLVNIKPEVQNAAAILKAIYRSNPKKLGDWGFKVDDSFQTKKKTKKETTTPPPSQV